MKLIGLHSYSYLPIVASTPDDTPKARGGISYLENNVGV